MPFYPYAVLQNYGFGNKYHNAFRTIHAASTMPKYSNFRKDYSRLSSYRKPIPGSTSGNTLAIRDLQRKVAGMKPEVQHFVANYNMSFSGGAFNIERIDITKNLASAADRDLRLTGDSWKNKYLKFRLQMADDSCDGILRVLIIKPKKAGTTFTFAENAIPDPNQMTVLYDRTITTAQQVGANYYAGGSGRVMIGHVSLKNLKSTFISTVAELGDVQMYVMYRNKIPTGSDTWALSTQLAYTNL